MHAFSSPFTGILVGGISILLISLISLHESVAIAINKAMHHKTLHVILVIRTTLLNVLLEKYDIDNAEMVSVKQLSEASI